MFKRFSKEVKQILIEELCKRYDKNNSILQAPFLKMHYDEDDIEMMIKENKRIEELIEELRKED